MYSSSFDGILFVEGQPDNATILGAAKVELNGIFTQAQLKNLDDVKRKLASQVKNRNGNSLVNFKYGQRSTFLTTLLGIDDVGWYGSGDIAKIQTPKV